MFVSHSENKVLCLSVFLYPGSRVAHGRRGRAVWAEGPALRLSRQEEGTVAGLLPDRQLV